MTTGWGHLRARYLHPGEWYVGRGPQWLHTVLGSCVAMVLWHADRCVGGLCHYVLPGVSPQGRGNGNYAEDALSLLTRALRQQGCDVSDCRVGLYGGGQPAMTAGKTECQDEPGARNAQEAWRLVGCYGLIAPHQDLGGHFYRRVTMNLQSGAVRVDRYRWTGGFRSPQPQS